MKSTFPGYYRPTEEEFKALWDQCLLSLDASVLLNLYRYSADTTEGFLRILRRFRRRLWVPRQAAFEYHENRLDVIAQQVDAYEEIDQLLDEAHQTVRRKLERYRRHPVIDAGGLAARVGGACDELRGELQVEKASHPDLLASDPLLESITVLLDGKVGQSYSPERRMEVITQAEARYRSKIPPGYADAGQKEGERQYGDAILWFQLLEKAAEDKRPVILVVDDTKDDWWWRFRGKTLGPRTELVDEMLCKAGVRFYMYGSDQFMYYAREYLKQRVDQSAINEVRQVRREQEAALAAEATVRELRRDTAERVHGLRQRQESANAMMSRLRHEAQSLDELLEVGLRSGEVDPDRYRRLLSRKDALERELEFHARRVHDLDAEIAEAISDERRLSLGLLMERDRRARVAHE